MCGLTHQDRLGPKGCAVCKDVCGKVMLFVFIQLNEIVAGMLVK